MNSKGNILVIDDTHETLSLLTKLLNEDGYAAYPADSGEMALASIEKRIPDLILFDIRMPGIDSYEVCRRIKSNNEYINIPIILLTTATETNDRIEGLRLGAVDYIIKPFEKEELLARVKIHMDLFLLNKKLTEQTILLKEHSEEINTLNEEYTTINEELSERNLQLQKLNEELLNIKKKAEENENKFRSYIENAPDGVFVTDEKGNYLDVNPAATIITGYSEDELLKMSFLDLTTIDSFDAALNNFRSLLETGISEKDITFRHKNGNQRWWSVGAVKLSETRYLGFVKDITERKKAEEKIKEASTNWQTTFDAIDDLIILLSVNHDIIEINKAGIDSINKTRADIIGKKCFHLLHNSNSPIANCPCDIALINKTVTVNEYSQDGRFFELTAWPVFDENNNIKAFTHIIKDITNRKHTEMELIRAKEKAEESDHLKTAFLANMSHEIRTPLNGIIGFSEMLARPDLSNEKKISYIEIIKECGNQLTVLINDLIDIAKIESNQISIVKSEININTLLNDLYLMYQPKAAEQNIDLQLLNDTVNFDGKIFTDAVRLKQIIINLVDNAIKFTHQGYIKFGYSAKINNDHIDLDFFVEDTGIGIEQQQKEIIFKPFRQVENGLSRSYEGSGLGLAITNALVKLLGGEIRLQSELGKGSVFYFTIPIK